MADGRSIRWGGLEDAKLRSLFTDLEYSLRGFDKQMSVSREIINSIGQVFDYFKPFVGTGDKTTVESTVYDPDNKHPILRRTTQRED